MNQMHEFCFSRFSIYVYTLIYDYCDIYHIKMYYLRNKYLVKSLTPKVQWLLVTGFLKFNVINIRNPTPSASMVNTFPSTLEENHKAH